MTSTHVGTIEVSRFDLVVSFLVMSLGLRFCASRKGRAVGGGCVHPKGANSMAGSGLGYRKALIGTGWAISLHLCINGIKKQTYSLVGPPFLTISG